ncbi:GNAT family N-acetyltransferase [Psychrobacillus sp. Sa2BUA9]|uniref:GNAT family N-acetyltransferase n=1 Tax=Psychrobacillus faecigallinarum TaxID=2762235 RepID=A0ABR8RBB0_9BACI|nr:GNAT family N-acetyltransferase [Psychrobacillus faecigallinarum]MBD7945073.1 GNAT family N-acetyltransferase [Psychrobacillus faecigallinarum]
MFSSERLDFRFYTEADLDFLYSMLSDERMTEFIGNGKTRNRKETFNFLQWIFQHYEQNNEYGLKLLVRKKDGVTIGHAGIVPQLIEGQVELEIGYWIAREYWGNRYASEAAETLLQRGLNQLGVGRFISLIQKPNLASRKVAEKIGMQLEREIILSDKQVCLYVYEK